MITQLEKEYGYKDSHFDFIHQYIRRICLSYGATLIYASSKRDKNCDVVLQYIKHKLYGFDFAVKPILEKDVLFFPSGYDSIKKIQVDFESQQLTKDAEEAYEEVIKVPKILVQSVGETEEMLYAEDDQDFLSRIKEMIDKEPGRKDSGSKPNLLNSLRKFGALVNSDNVPNTNIGASSASPPPATAPQVASSVPVLSVDPAKPTTEHQVLAEFLNSLINKGDKPSTPTISVPSRQGATSPRPPGTTTPPPNQSLSKSSSVPASSREDIAKQLDRIRGKMNQ